MNIPPRLITMIFVSSFLLFNSAFAQSSYNDGVEAYSNKQYDKAFEIFEPLAEQGDDNAQYYMGLHYRWGYGVKQSDDKAFEWFMKSAELGDLDSQRQVGIYYQDGRGVEKSGEKALEWFLKASEQGQRYAQLSAGIIYENGDHTEKSYEQAAYWYQKSADQDEETAQAYLAELYERGRGVDQNTELAIELYIKSIAGGEEYGIERLEGVIEENTPDNTGKSSAFLMGSDLFQNGNPEGALKLWVPLAENGDRDSQVILGALYENGQGGMAQSYAKALHWYQKAAVQGHADAQFNLGALNGNGFGVEANMPLAKFWFTLADKNGNAAAAAALQQF